jgi:amino acid transporter
MLYFFEMVLHLIIIIIIKKKEGKKKEEERRKRKRFYIYAIPIIYYSLETSNFKGGAMPLMTQLENWIGIIRILVHGSKD